MGAAEVGAPPKFPDVADFDGSWHFCRLMYRSVRSQQRGLGWGTDYPYADINFSIRLSELTKTRSACRTASPTTSWSVPPIPSVFQCPFVMASDPRQRRLLAGGCRAAARLPAEGRLPLGRRLLGAVGVGGVRRRDRQGVAAGEFPIKEIGLDHPIYRTLFRCLDSAGAVDAVLAHDRRRTSEMDDYARKAHMAAIIDQAGPHHGADDAQHRHRRLVGARRRRPAVLLPVLTERLRGRPERRALCADPTDADDPPCPRPSRSYAAAGGLGDVAAQEWERYRGWGGRRNPAALPDRRPASTAASTSAG